MRKTGLGRTIGGEQICFFKEKGAKKPFHSVCTGVVNEPLIYDSLTKEEGFMKRLQLLHESDMFKQAACLQNWTDLFHGCRRALTLTPPWTYTYAQMVW